MATPSTLYSQTGLAIHVHQPLTQGNALVADLTRTVNSYQHVIDSSIGYQSASFSFPCNPLVLEEWLEYGLGRRLIVYNEASAIIWEGFVNEISGNLGAISVTRGPLMDICNRLAVAFQTMSYNTNPPIGGVEDRTDFADELDSQTLYGILEQVYNAGEADIETAERYRDTYLAEIAWPNTQPTLNLSPGSMGEVSMSVNCLGYGAWLEKSTYLDFDDNFLFTQNLSDKLRAAVAAETNGFISTNDEEIILNALQVPIYDNDNRTLLTVIRELVALGDTSDNRYTFGIYAGRKARYQPAPTVYEYEYKVSERAQRVASFGGGIVKPWDVLPCKWLFLPDFLVGYNQPGLSMYTDPRAVFIESVTYTAPFGLQIAGNRFSRAAQQLARMGLKGL